MKRLTDEQRPLVELACRFCREADEAYTGLQRPCAWKSFDKEYCPNILDALQETKKERVIDLLTDAVHEFFRFDTLELAAEGIVKGRPLKPTRTEDGTLVCPYCGQDTIFAYCSECEHQLNYCNNCGQRLDWDPSYENE